MKLLKLICLCGVGSRRSSFELIRQNKVSVNGKTVNEPSHIVQINDSVAVNDREISIEKYVYIALNKPRGYICTTSDPHADKKALDLINCPYRVFNVGRLDKDSEGLIIFTNDGDYANKLTHPSNSITKQYEVVTSTKIPASKLKKLLEGVFDQGELLKALFINEISDNKYIFTMGEGKKREIRRMIAFTGAEVRSLTRICIGSLKLGNLKTGHWKYMSDKEISMSLSKS
ncbi:MAG: hypothetical protein A2X47_00520 [Lentisphaerae bacterium GWF2_38_69]|nr:MAG: hypothetical protein A2X47_00520 [Lentisphaerae bacterium GWF2_38_69]